MLIIRNQYLKYMNINLGMMIDLEQNNSPTLLQLKIKMELKMIIVNTYIPYGTLTLRNSVN